MRVLLTGANGMLARDLIVSAPASVVLDARSRAELDITDPVAVRRAVEEGRPDVIINCAAYTAVDRAESEPDRANAVNALGPANLGQAADAALVLHFSTDYVFDGSGPRPWTTGDATGPLGVYGLSKRAGEAALASSGARFIILRTSWLAGLHGRSFPRTMWERARRAEATRVVNDQWGRPTFAADLAAGVWRLLNGPAGGPVTVLHASNSGPPTTWYDIAVRIFTRYDRADLVRPCVTADYPTAATRPANSVLDTTDFDTGVGPLPDWTRSLDAFLGLLEAE